MAKWQGFWSYVHRDNSAEGGRIVQLARDLSDQYELISGEDLDLFIDRDSIALGDAWKQEIYKGLNSVACFIPVLTPRYFMSSSCRDELQSFAKASAQLGVTELVIPLVYIDISELHQDDPEDEMVALVRRYQWQDWRQLRFEDRSSSSYRQAVAQLAERIRDVNRDLSSTVSSNLHDSVSASEDQEAPGTLDRLAELEDTISSWSESLASIGRGMQQVGLVMNRGTRRLKEADPKKNVFAFRKSVTRQVAHEMEEPVAGIQRDATSFVAHMHEADLGIRTVIALVGEHSGELAPHDEESDAAQLFQTIRSAAQTIGQTAKQSRDIVEALEPFESFSRDLRPVVRKLRTSLVSLAEAEQVAGSWIDAIESIGE